MLKTDGLLHIFVETATDFILYDSLMSRNVKKTAFIWNRNLLQHVFTVKFDASLMNKKY